MPHMSQLDIRVRADGRDQDEGRVAAHWYVGKALEIYVNGEAFELGRSSGADNNCLIDTLRQKLPNVICCQKAVRKKLEERNGIMEARITSIQASFWSSTSVWRSSIYWENTMRSDECRSRGRTVSK